MQTGHAVIQAYTTTQYSHIIVLAPAGVQCINTIEHAGIKRQQADTHTHIRISIHVGMHMQTGAQAINEAYVWGSDNRAYINDGGRSTNLATKTQGHISMHTHIHECIYVNADGHADRHTLIQAVIHTGTHTCTNTTCGHT